MTTVSAFSTDWSTEPVVDEYQSQLQGKQVFTPGKKRLLHGGTMYYRLTMPLMEMNRQSDDWDISLAWRFQVAPDGHLRTLTPAGEWVDPDVVALQRWMSIDAKDQFLRARASGQRIICDLDDDFWALGKTNIAYHTTDPKKNPTFNRQHYWDSFSACDAITVSTEALRKRVERLNKPTYVLRNAVALDEWPILDPGQHLVAGWIGGVQWRSHDLTQLHPALGYWMEDNADENPVFYHGGDSNADLTARARVKANEILEAMGIENRPPLPQESEFVPRAWDQAQLNLDNVNVMAHPLVPIWEYPTLWQPMSIALIPLERCAFNQAKSWLKLLESSACGLPAIVSKGFHEQDLLIAEGSAARVADNTKWTTWYDHLTELLDPDLRREEGKINREIAAKHDIKDRWKEWDAAYKEIMAL